jgi:phage gp29-like protein
MPITTYESIDLASKSAGGSGKELGPLNTSEYEDFDKVAQKKGYRIYRDMVSYDDMVSFGTTSKKLLLLGSGYDITPYDESAQAKEQADFISAMFNAMERSFKMVQYDSFSAFEYGFAVGNKIWIRNKTNKNPLLVGKTILKDIKMKFPWDTDFIYDEFGNLNKLLVGGEEVDQKSFIIYSYLPQFGNLKGRSDLKSAYNGYWLRDNVSKFWARHLERYGSPIVKGHVPPGATADESNRFFVAINRMQHITGIMLPRTQQGNGQEFDFELVESKREGGSQFRDAIDSGDSRILRSFLFPRLWGITKESFGSYAVGQTQIQLALFIFTFICDDYSDSVVNRQIIRQAIDINFPVPLYPTFRQKPPSESTIGALLQEIADVKNPKVEPKKEEPQGE